MHVEQYIKLAFLHHGAALATTLFSLDLSDMPRLPQNRLVLYANDTVLLSQSWFPAALSNCNDSTPIIHYVETPIKYPQNWNHYIFQAPHSPPPPLPDPMQILDTFFVLCMAVRYLELVLDPPIFYTQHLHTVVNKATAVLGNIFPHLVWDSKLTQSSKLTVYKLLIRSIVTYVAPVFSSTCSSSYLRLQAIQS
jgi:hypothetical protein